MTSSLLNQVLTTGFKHPALRPFQLLITNKYVLDAGMIADNAMRGFDSSHDFRHVLRVLKNSLHILPLESRARSVVLDEDDVMTVILTALFHDVADKKYADESKLTLSGALHNCIGSHEPQILSRVLRAVPLISYSTELQEPQVSMLSLEAACVQDADRLDAIGAIGIARCFTFGGAKGRSLLDTREHFDDKLFRLEGMFKTQAARDVASKRNELMRQFALDFDEQQEL
jgi:uncharacterized protein